MGSTLESINQLINCSSATLKQGRLAAGFSRSVQDQVAGLPPSVIEQNTYWFDRQLINTQLVGEFEFGDLGVDVRAAYANARRNSPYERAISYFYLGDGNPATRSVSDVTIVNNPPRRPVRAIASASSTRCHSGGMISL